MDGRATWIDESTLHEPPEMYYDPHHDLNLMLAFLGNMAFVEGFENY